MNEMKIALIFIGLGICLATIAAVVLLKDPLAAHNKAAAEEPAKCPVPSRINAAGQEVICIEVDVYGPVRREQARAELQAAKVNDEVTK